MTTSRMARRADGSFVATSIPGVQGQFPAVELLVAGGNIAVRYSARLTGAARRSLLRGHMPLYQASPALAAWLAKR
ncbi:hypothetical protein [Janthinobacterium sp. RB2R34]|uniref:hypothetical protein n=1 Tax=Janthinobacterium sp. RB2R34 TaxID=3424193 RepID=UPI003F25D137